MQQAQPRPAKQFSITDLAGTYRDPATIAETMERAAQHFNLLGAATTATIPDGCGVSFNAVKFDPALPPKGSDVFKTGDKLALTKPAIDKLANMAGVWTAESRCLRYERRICEYVATVAMRNFDGTVITKTASRLIDLREGSPYLDSLRARSSGGDRDRQAKEILAMLAAHTETKAILRATRMILGIRAYTAEEIAKPFVIPRIMFTGESKDPHMRALYGAMLAQSFLGGVSAMFGPRPTQGAASMFGMPQAPAMPALPQGPYVSGGPSTGNVGDLGYDDEDEDVGGGDAPLPPPPPPKAGDPGRIFMPGKKGETPLVKDASDKDLAYWEGRLSKAIGEGTSQMPDKDQEKLLTIQAEMRKRSGAVDPQDEPPMDPGLDPDNDGR
jgi:hypothetical protein